VHPPRWGRFFWARNTSISAGAEQSIILTIIRSLGGSWLPAHFSKGSTYGLSSPRLRPSLWRLLGTMVWLTGWGIVPTRLGTLMMQVIFSSCGLSFPQSWGPFLLKLGAGKSAAGKSQI
jgi:hypothetical protein